jgi:hypothetical protein
MEIIALAQTMILTITLLVLYFYTAETAALRRETVRQTRIILRPVVVPLFDRSSQTSYIFKLQNIGSSSAFNIRVKPHSKNLGFGNIEYHFRPIDFLSPQTSKVVTITQQLDGQPHQSDLTDKSFFPIYATSEENLLILFDDVEGHTYSLSVTITPSDHPGFWEGVVKLGNIDGLEFQKRGCIKSIIDRIFGWYP